MTSRLSSHNKWTNYTQTHTKTLVTSICYILWNSVSSFFQAYNSTVSRGGALNFFSGRDVRPGFPKCGACELTFASEKGGLWAENFQIWGLVSWKFPNLGACELKFGLKLRLLRLKLPNFLKRGSCELTLLLEMGPLRAAGEAWKGGLQGRTSPYPLSRSVPPWALFTQLTYPRALLPIFESNVCRKPVHNSPCIWYKDVLLSTQSLHQTYILSSIFG